MGTPHIILQGETDHRLERQRLVDGLRKEPAYFEPKYFYDEQGCAIYNAICQLDEYYPTRTEKKIFEANRHEIAAEIGQVDTLVDLGAGDCQKAVGWMPYLKPSQYLAVDIAESALRGALTPIAGDFPQLVCTGLVTDFSQGLTIPDALHQGRTTLFYPGSSIGNFAPDRAQAFLRELRAYASNGLLIGVDAKKDKRTLDAAYDDALGVTASFNLNALRHINRLIGTNFDCADWRHVGYYSPEYGRVEMHLEAKRDLAVLIDGVPRYFKAGSRIHSESSYKYSRHEFETLLSDAGFSSISCWTDEASAFWVFVAR